MELLDCYAFRCWPKKHLGMQHRDSICRTAVSIRLSGALPASENCFVSSGCIIPVQFGCPMPIEVS